MKYSANLAMRVSITYASATARYHNIEWFTYEPVYSEL